MMNEHCDGAAQAGLATQLTLTPHDRARPSPGLLAVRIAKWELSLPPTMAAAQTKGFSL